MVCNYTIATRQSSDHTTSYCSQFDAAGNGNTIWKELKENQKLSSQESENNAKGKIISI